MRKTTFLLILGVFILISILISIIVYVFVLKSDTSNDIDTDNIESITIVSNSGAIPPPNYYRYSYDVIFGTFDVHYFADFVEDTDESYFTLSDSEQEKFIDKLTSLEYKENKECSKDGGSSYQYLAIQMKDGENFTINSSDCSTSEYVGSVKTVFNFLESIEKTK